MQALSAKAAGPRPPPADKPAGAVLSRVFYRILVGLSIAVSWQHTVQTAPQQLQPFARHAEALAVVRDLAAGLLQVEAVHPLDLVGLQTQVFSPARITVQSAEAYTPARRGSKRPFLLLKNPGIFCIIQTGVS